jgi:hypothetical protein
VKVYLQTSRLKADVKEHPEMRLHIQKMGEDKFFQMRRTQSRWDMKRKLGQSAHYDPAAGVNKLSFQDYEDWVKKYWL